MLRRGTSHWFVFDLLDGGVCVCVPRALEGGGSGEVGHKLCFQQNKWPAGLQGRLDLNTHFLFYFFS